MARRTVHALAFAQDEAGSREFLLDIDYIVMWHVPEGDRRSFSFDVAPATLVFEDVWRLQGALDVDVFPVTLDAITRAPGDSDQVHNWRLEGDIELEVAASGFSQYFRASPIRVPRQHLELSERGAVSFERNGRRTPGAGT